MLSAMNLWIESSEVKPNQLSGAKTKMSEDHKEEQANENEELLREKKELQDELASIRKENDGFIKTVDELKTNEVNGLVDQVIETGVAANLYESDDVDKVKTELKNLSAQTLREKLSDYKRVEKLVGIPRDVKSTAVVNEEKAVEQTPEKDPLVYTKDELKAGLREALGGLRTSENAQKVMKQKIAFDSYNPNREEYLRIFDENSRKARRLD